MMRPQLTTLMISLSLSVPVFADSTPSNLHDGFTSLCVTEKIVSLNQHNRGWLLSAEHPRKKTYIIRKIPRLRVDESKLKYLWCDIGFKEQDKVIEFRKSHKQFPWNTQDIGLGIESYKNCYNIKEFRDKYFYWKSVMGTELWLFDKNKNTWQLESITILPSDSALQSKHVNFQPTGDFVMTNVGENLEIKENYSEMSAGQCSVVSEPD